MGLNIMKPGTHVPDKQSEERYEDEPVEYAPVHSGGRNYTDWRQIPSPVSAVKAAYEVSNSAQKAGIRAYFKKIIDEHANR